MDLIHLENWLGGFWAPTHTHTHYILRAAGVHEILMTPEPLPSAPLLSILLKMVFIVCRDHSAQGRTLLPDSLSPRPIILTGLIQLSPQWAPPREVTWGPMDTFHLHQHVL